jgi:hypothetical protein
VVTASKVPYKIFVEKLSKYVQLSGNNHSIQCIIFHVTFRCEAGRLTHHIQSRFVEETWLLLFGPYGVAARHGGPACIRDRRIHHTLLSIYHVDRS